MADGRARRVRPARAAELLGELRQAHDELSAALRVMEEVTAETVPDSSRYPHARWRLSQASRKRRSLTSAACAELLDAIAPEEIETVERFKAEDALALRQSAAHVRSWPTESITADWPGYCRASHVIRSAMKERIAAERRLLYPLLDRHSR